MLPQHAIATELIHRLKAPDIIDVPTPLPMIMKKTMTWADLLQYFRTSSALRNFHDKHPEDMGRSDGDISERLMLQLVRSVEEREGCLIKPEEDQIQVKWPLGLLQARMEQ
jgi:trans-aconitate 3-methyltransferase